MGDGLLATVLVDLEVVAREATDEVALVVGDGDVDLIYAGDLNGNMWRFAATPGTGFDRAGATILYSATNAAGTPQRITRRW